MKKLVLLCATVLLAGCTKGSNPVCDILKVGLGPAAEYASSPEIGKCADPAALEACFKADLDKTPICKPKDAAALGFVGNLVCPRIGDSLKNILLKNYCPQAKCTGGALVGEGYDKFVAVCKTQIQF